MRWLARRKVIRVRYPLTWSSVRKWFTLIPATIFVLFVGYSIITIIRGRKGWIEERCGDTGNACGVVIGFASPFLSLALATALFLLYRYWKIRRPIVRKARRRPQELVPTARTAVNQIVGRKQLCEVICRSLRDHTGRRPYVLVGSVGAGKTAVLVQLTQMLARQHRVPVPVRLREVGTDGTRLDFRELAERRFTEETDPGALLSAEQSAKVWRQLCKDGRAVVLADGLEEALTANGQSADRDNVIRAAIHRAERQNLPLVIASRPHTPLEATYASIIDLEPLSEEAALDFLARNDPAADSQRLDWIVETAAVSESPLYMEIAQQLRRHHLLEHLDRGKTWDHLDTRSRDRSTLRLRLLMTWETALVGGHLHDEVALTRQERESTIQTISLLAALGLLQDRLEVRFKDLVRVSETASAEAILKERLRTLHTTVDDRDCKSVLALYATQGEQLGLVETLGDRVRFPHSILQAYLGSRYLSEFPAKVDAALRSGTLGRELLIALVLQACRNTPETTKGVAQRLLAAAGERKDWKVLDLFATALEVDLHAQLARPSAPVSIHTEIAQAIEARWHDIDVQDRRTVDEARERLIHRFGEVLREIGHLQGSSRWPEGAPGPAYKEFFAIAIRERSYALRLAITQEIGAGRDPAFIAALNLDPGLHQSEPTDPVATFQYMMKKARARASAPGNVPLDEEAAEPFECRINCREDAGNCRGPQAVWREFATRAWLIPMLVGSVSTDRRADAQRRLRQWLDHLDPAKCPGGRADLPLSFEVALAQGFKSAANRRKRHPDTTNDTREFLVEQAEKMLAQSRFWFSQLTLIHALSLWELPDHSGRVTADGKDLDDVGRPPPPTDAPRDAVRRWLTLAGSERAPADRRAEDQRRQGRRERLHPFVAGAAHLAVLALETGRPEQYIWIDEKGAMEKVGSDPGDPRFYRKHNLWIPPSVGWSTLDPRAQQLLADVLLLLNLTERTGDPDALEARLEKARRNSLPPCLTEDRSPLQPGDTVGMARRAEPGSTCPRDCRFELCPYPPKGEMPRAELTEVFCLQQQALLRWRRGGFFALTRKPARWQGMTGKDLRRFWGSMAARTRTPRPP
ncbi:NACHT domain-containing protein [Kitasatospora sp. NPDC058218]|uniref:NACHT domain-containing protein n=1 Tax=Kitasatospora sp. NPDC058218 TaxID=3346385 RepID=UPI0036D97810